MENYDLINIRKYSPGNDAFLKKSIELFQSEITIFVEELKTIKKTKDLNLLRQKIHKIKPSSELFTIPKPILYVLNTLYELSDSTKILNDYEKGKIEINIDDLIKFYNLLNKELFIPLNELK